MKLQVFAVRDNATQTFGLPVFVRHQGEAVRSFVDQCKDKTSNFNKHPADYDLYHIGEYDDDTAEITSDATNRVARATDHAE